MKVPRLLLAKTPRGPEPVREETLVGHTQKVCEMADLLTDILAPKLRTTMGCDDAETAHWKSAVVLGAWMHDWRKSNDHFQTMLRNPAFKQGVRHETLTLILVEYLSKWLGSLWSERPSWVKCAALFAASGHHLKFPDPAADSRTGTEVTVFIGHSDFSDVLRLKAHGLGLPEPPPLENRTVSLLRRGDLRKILDALERELDTDLSDKEKVLVASVKSAVMAADLCGSALPAKVEDPQEWLESRLARVLNTDQLTGVVDTKLQGRKPRSFQVRVQGTSSLTTLVEAGCGSGKTAAAYLWASRNADGRRLFFCYPTTATASEGFAGYLSDPDFEAILVHSRAEVDYRLLDNMPNRLHEENELREARLEALEVWPVPAVVCTAHTVLGLMENVRRGLYAWPSLVQSAFVFDEVHAFSTRLFSYLLRFLQAFRGAPVLLMTATLPPARKRALERCCLQRGGLDVIEGPPLRESAPRYRLRVSNLLEVWGEAEKSLGNGGKVLWVCNTVGRAMKVAAKAVERGLPVQPYHSRYRYRDRLVRQRTVIDGFAPEMPSMLAVSTQVAEMSLDLSADLLISEWAPVPSMIQRLGRLNRFEEEPQSLGTALLLEPENILPYDEEKMSGLAEWLQLVADDRPRSQAQLAKAFVEVAADTGLDAEPAAFCEWLDGLWRSLKDQRAIEEAGYSVEVVRQEDLDLGTCTELAIPMPVPKGLSWKEWAREGRYLVAPAGTIAYDSFGGAEWQTSKK